MEIGKISLHTLKATESSVSQNNTALNRPVTNPFGVSFKGNVIQADVFQSTAKKATTGLGEKSKLFASAVVSGINNFNEAFKSRMNAVVSFAKKATSNIFDTIERIGNTEIKLDLDRIKNTLFPDRKYSVKNLTNKPVDEIRTMWAEMNEQKIM